MGYSKSIKYNMIAVKLLGVSTHTHTFCPPMQEKREKAPGAKQNKTKHCMLSDLTSVMQL